MAGVELEIQRAGRLVIPARERSFLVGLEATRGHM